MLHLGTNHALQVSAFLLQLALLLCTSVLCTSTTSFSTDRHDILSPLSSCPLVPTVPSVHTSALPQTQEFCLLPFCLCQWQLSLILIVSLTENSALQCLRGFLPLDLSTMPGKKKKSCFQSSCSDGSRCIGKRWALILLSSPPLFTSMPGNSLFNKCHFPWPFPSQDQCHHMARDIFLLQYHMPV